MSASASPSSPPAPLLVGEGAPQALRRRARSAGRAARGARGRGARARRRERLRASRRCSRSCRGRSRPTPARSRSTGAGRVPHPDRRASRRDRDRDAGDDPRARPLDRRERLPRPPHGPKRGPLIDWRGTRRRALAALQRLGLDVDPSLPVRRLRPDQQQMVEIARALSIDARVLILDEPTSSLTDDEVAGALRRSSASCGRRASQRSSSRIGSRRSSTSPTASPSCATATPSARGADRRSSTGRKLIHLMVGPRARGDRAAGRAGAARASLRCAFAA